MLHQLVVVLALDALAFAAVVIGALTGARQADGISEGLMDGLATDRGLHG